MPAYARLAHVFNVAFVCDGEERGINNARHLIASLSMLTKSDNDSHVGVGN